MILQKRLLGHLVALGILFGATAATAQMPMDNSQQTTEFRRIDQPTGLKIGLTIGGFALIGLELWWFLHSKNKA